MQDRGQGSLALTACRYGLRQNEIAGRYAPTGSWYQPMVERGQRFARECDPLQVERIGYLEDHLVDARLEKRPNAVDDLGCSANEHPVLGTELGQSPRLTPAQPGLTRPVFRAVEHQERLVRRGNL